MPKWHYIEIKSEHHILVKQPWQTSWVLRWLPKLLDNSLHLAVSCVTFWDVLVLLIGFSYYIRKNKAQKYDKLYHFNGSTTTPWACQWGHLCVMAFEAHLDSHQVTSIRNWWEFFWILSLNMYLRTQNGGELSTDYAAKGWQGSVSKISLKPLLEVDSLQDQFLRCRLQADLCGYNWSRKSHKDRNSRNLEGHTSILCSV